MVAKRKGRPRRYNRGMATLTESRKASLRREMEALLGPGAVLSDPDELLVYESDGLTLFRALADRTRRDVLRRAMNGTLSVSGLARLYPMSTTAVQKHVAVLEEAGLVHLTRRGRQLLVQTEIESVAKAQVLLAEFERLWRGRLEPPLPVVGRSVAH